MIPIEKVKKLIGKTELSDEEVGKVRDDLYVLANLSFEHWRETHKKKNDINGRTSKKV